MCKPQRMPTDEQVNKQVAELLGAESKAPAAVTQQDENGDHDG